MVCNFLCNFLECLVDILNTYYFNLKDTCSSFYFNFNRYSEGFLILISLVFDILAIIKFRQIYSNNSSMVTSSFADRTKRRQEKIMLIQVRHFFSKISSSCFDHNFLLFHLNWMILGLLESYISHLFNDIKFIEFRCKHRCSRTQDELINTKLFLQKMAIRPHIRS